MVPAEGTLEEEGTVAGMIPIEGTPAEEEIWAEEILTEEIPMTGLVTVAVWRVAPAVTAMTAPARKMIGAAATSPA